MELFETSESTAPALPAPTSGLVPQVVGSREHRKRSFKEVCASFVLRSLITMGGLALRSYFPFLLLRLINFRGNLIKSVFFCYGGNTRYIEHYSFQFQRPFIKWFPSIIGIYKQGKYWGLVFASTVTEKDFTDLRNREKTTLLINRLNLIAKLTGAKNLQLAGILPSFLEKRIPTLRFTSSPVTAKAVMAAANQVEKLSFGGQSRPIILLGGNGKIGQMLQEELRFKHIDVFIVDPSNGLAELPKELFGRQCLLIDVSRANCLQRYIDQLWTGIVILNETFPEPRGQTLRDIRAKGIKMYHLSGVKGKVYPSLPMGYAGSVPCCALHDISEVIQPVLKEL